MARNAPDTRTTKKNIHTRQRGPLQPVLTRLTGERPPCTKRRTKRTYPADGVGRAARWHGTHQIPEQPKTIHTRQRGAYQPVLSRWIGERRPAQNAARNAPIRRMRSAGLLDGTERTRYPNN